MAGLGSRTWYGVARRTITHGLDAERGEQPLEQGGCRSALVCKRRQGKTRTLCSY